jgi:TPR repeat protein
MPCRFHARAASPHALISAALCATFALSSHTQTPRIPPEQLTKAEQALQYGDTTVLPTILQAADQGSTAAKHDLGLIFLAGYSSHPADPVLALQWFEAASHAGDPRSASYIGDFYTNPRNGKPDAPNALYWYEKAERTHDLRGTILLSDLYRKGGIIPRDIPHSANILAIAAGFPKPLATDFIAQQLVIHLMDSETALGSIYEHGDGVPRSTVLANRWYTKAAALGSAPAVIAQINLYLAKGGAQNLALATKTLDKLVDAQDHNRIVESTDQIGPTYIAIGRQYETRGPAGIDTAQALFLKAANFTSTEGLFELAQRFITGDGTPVDLDRAYNLIQPYLLESSQQARAVIGALREAYLKATPPNIMRAQALSIRTTPRIPVEAAEAAAFAGPPPATPPTILERYPNLQAPDTVAPLQDFAVQVSLNAFQFDTNTQILNGDQDNGQLKIALPAGLSSMPIDVALIAPGMIFTDGTNTGTLTLDATNPNSVPAIFHVRAPAAPKATQLIATLTYHQTFLAQLARNITITAATTDAASQPQTPTVGIAAPVNPNNIPSPTRSDTTPIGEHLQSAITKPAPTQPAAPKPPVVTMLPPRPIAAPTPQPVLPDPTDKLSDLTIIETLVGDSMMYQILGPGIDPAAPVAVPNAAATAAKVQSDYSQLQSQALLLAAGTGAACAADRASHAAKPANDGSDTDPSCSDSVFARGLIEGIGTDLYTHDAPESFRTIYQQMLTAHTRLHSITVVTNNPLLPWELMCVPSPTGKGCNLLGLTTAIVRENSAAPQLAQPADIPFSSIDVVAPNYTGTLSLAGVATELKSIKTAFPAMHQVGGDANSVSLMVKSAPQGIIHFTGHGKRVDSSTPAPVPAQTTAATSTPLTAPVLLAPSVAIALEDYDMTPDTFIAFRAEGNATAHPFYFFNACDLGQSDKELTYVAGWAPDLMRSGAAGYLGALYEVGDASASSFAAHFYDGLKANLASNTPWTMADLVTQARQQTYAESNDPTALAYVLYAKPFMKLIPTKE